MTLEEKLEMLAGLKLGLEARTAAFEAEIASTTDAIKSLETEVKAEVLALGQTVKTDHISAIWNKGKTTWDGKLLEGYAVAHHEILAAKKTGQPTVSFKLAK